MVLGPQMSDEHREAMARVMGELRSLLKGTGWYILKLTEDGHAITKWEYFPEYVLDAEPADFEPADE